MKRWLRRLRGTLGTATIWGTCGAALGAVLGGLTGVPASGPVLSWMLDGAVQLGALGFGVGGAFAALLTAFEGRRSLAQLSPARAAVWGASAGLALSSLAWLLSGAVIPVLPVALATGLGAFLGGVSVSIARSDSLRLPEGSEPAHDMLTFDRR